MILTLRNVVVSLSVALLLAGAVDACSMGASPTSIDHRPDLRQSDIIGTWCSTSDEGVINFEANGKFAASKFPYEVVNRYVGLLPANFDRTHDVITVSGAWSLTSSREDPRGPHNTIKLHIWTVPDRSVNGSVTMSTRRVDGVAQLLFYVIDPDLNAYYTYVKSASLCDGHRRSSSK